jgi:hypothetical protein
VWGLSLSGNQVVKLTNVKFSAGRGLSVEIWFKGTIGTTKKIFNLLTSSNISLLSATFAGADITL